MKYLLNSLLLFTFIACAKSTPNPAEISKKSAYLGQKELKGLDFTRSEVISVKIKDQFYYVRKDGKIISTLTYDGKADAFSDGFARTRVNGKVGFFNSNLDIVLKPIYDFAFPFHNGIAEICMGCKETNEDGTAMLDGGKWKKINREGLVKE
jgi:hypothetical protein